MYNTKLTIITCQRRSSQRVGVSERVSDVKNQFNQPAIDPLDVWTLMPSPWPVKYLKIMDARGA
jgi:hypothetical protein